MTPVTLKRLSTRIRVVDESADWLVVEKPPFLQAHPSKPDGSFTLWEAVRQLLAFEIANGGQVSLINRLDRETSGLTLIAKHRAAARDLSRFMMRREIHKEYLAIVWGWPERDQWEIDLPILRQGDVQPSAIWLKQMVHPEGAAARTRVRVEQRLSTHGSEFAVVRAIPETGRMHQIRVHLAASGHPVVGDKIYGPSEQCYLDFIETGWTERLRRILLIERHALHSAVLRIASLGLEWRSDLPPDLACALTPEPGANR